MKNNEANRLDYSDLNIKKPPLMDIDYGTALRIVVVTTLLFGVLTFYSETAASVIVLLVMTVGFYFAASVQVNFEDKVSNRLKKFAIKNGFKFDQFPGDVWGSGTIFDYGSDKNMLDMISGKFHDLPFRIYKYTYTKGSGKNAVDYRSTIIDFTLPRKLPHMVINSLVEEENLESSTLPIKFDSSQKIELEGDFSKYFALYAPDKYSVTALTILAPDTMEAVLEQAAFCDIEIIANKIYFYWPNVEVSQASYRQKFAAVSAVLDKIGDKLTHGDIFAKTSQARIAYSGNPHFVRLKGIKWPRYRTFAISIAALLVCMYFLSYKYAVFLEIVVNLLVIGMFLHFFGNIYHRKRLEKSLTSRYGTIRSNTK